MRRQFFSTHRHTRVVTVFGGSGFIGRSLVKRLAARGVTVRVAGRDPRRAHTLQPLGNVSQIIPWPVNYANPDSITAALEGADGAVNLVGILFQTRHQTFDTIHARIPEMIATAAQQSGVWRLVHVSAIGADKKATAAYARSKAHGEAALRTAFPKAVILRPSVVFGPDDNFFNKFAMMARFAPLLPVVGCPWPRLDTRHGWPRIDLYGGGGPRFQPVFVGDVAQACLNALNTYPSDGKKQANLYELGGPTIYSFRELMDMLLTHTERRRALLPVPLSIARALALVLERLPGPPVLTRDQTRLLEHDNVVSPRALTLGDLGIDATAAESILPTYLDRFRPRRPRKIRGMAPPQHDPDPNRGR